MMLLQSVLDGNIPSKLIVFEETSQVRSLPFLNLLFKSGNQRFDLLHFVCFKEQPDFYRYLVPHGIKVQFYDGFSDPLDWDPSVKSIDFATDVLKVNRGTSFAHVIVEQIKQSSGIYDKVAVVFDDLSLLCRHKSINEICRMITSLATSKSPSFEITQVITILQKDLLSELTINGLKYVADACVSLDKKCESNTSLNKGKDSSATYKVDVIVKKKSGKVMREVGLYNFTRECKLFKLKDISLLNQNEDEMKQSDPTANLPFNLKLTETEKDARSQVRLPYTLDKEQKAVQLGTQGSGKIIYQPDDADDFDEEDPDDDLDI